MKNRFLQYLFLSCSVVVLFSACRKDPFKGKETLESGKTFVWITEAQVHNQFFDVFTDIKPVTMFSVRRDAASKADLQKAITVKLKALDQSYIDASNTKNGTDYTLMPADLYTLGAQPGVSIAANADLTLNFAAGDFAKNVIFNVDGSKVDLSKQYAVAYVITDFGGFSKKHDGGGTSQDTILATVAIKNRWDGIYSATGSVTDKANSALTDINLYLTTNHPELAPMQYEFRTVSATTCTVFDNVLQGAYVFDISSGTANFSSYGSFAPVFTFDPATNKVVSVTNYYGQPAGNGRYATMDPTTPNIYDPTSKTITVSWGMYGGSLVGAHEKRTQFDYVFTYVGSR